MELLLYGKLQEKICLKFYPCINKGEKISWEEWHITEPLTIYLSDYRQFILKFLCDIYPVIDPTNGEDEEHFDECFDNWIGKNDWTQIIQRIKKHIILSSNEQEILFYNKFVEWIEKQLEWADIIVVDGNL